MILVGAIDGTDSIFCEEKPSGRTFEGKKHHFCRFRAHFCMKLCRFACLYAVYTRFVVILDEIFDDTLVEKE